MKKIYEKPIAIVVDVELESLLNTTSGELDEEGGDPNTPVKPGTGGMAKEHYSVWD
ncbi:MAG: hypothetical protein J6A02_06720 [Prevotella sp.]|nr:hypothetical protein [Prevotella sp.]